MPVQRPRNQQNGSSLHTLSDGTAVQLFSSTLTTNSQINHISDTSSKSYISDQSSEDLGDSCRICRWNRQDMEIIRCPCNCRGSVGFIHLQCLKRWMLQRRDNHCEICHERFDLPHENISIIRMFRTFFCMRCLGSITRHIVSGASLLPLAHVVLQQILICLENINQNPTDGLTFKEVLVCSCALMTSSALFFHYFEYITTRFMLVRDILSHWWTFGGTSDFSTDEPILETFDIF